MDDSAQKPRLREQVRRAILERRFWGAKVDTSPSKAISLSGGSLQRVSANIRLPKAVSPQDLREACQ